MIAPSALLPALLLDPVVLVRAFYLAASALILVIHALPAFRSRFLAYGSRATSPAGPRTSATTRRPAATKPDALKPGTSRAGTKPPAMPLPALPPASFDRLLDWAATLQVPHNYFSHFYVLSVTCSFFWARHLQLWDAPAQLQLVWLLMLLQGLRRMLESLTYTSTSKSKMWIGHWLFGVTFYFTINIAVWAEGINDTGAGTQGWKTAILVPAILSAHALQHTYHAYLYHLRAENKDYQLPSHPLFPNLVCPHYTCEIAIYVLLSILAAPSGRAVNWTLASGALLVMINLGVTAAGTKTWYEEKFGKDKVSDRKKMIPFVW